MALIETVEPEETAGKTKEICDTKQKNAGAIPAPMQAANASPWMLDMIMSC